VGRSENFLLLRDVLHRVGTNRESFMSTYADEVVVHEIGQKVPSEQRLSASVDDDTKKPTTATGNMTRIEFVRMSNTIRRLLNIDISLVSTVDCDAGPSRDG